MAVAEVCDETLDEIALLQITHRHSAIDATAQVGFLHVLAPEQFVELPGAQGLLRYPQPEEGRHETCIRKEYDIAKMPSVSVVIPYLHENLMLLEHTLGSLLANTPAALLDAIILVDDANVPGWDFNATLLHLSLKVRVHRNEERQGLIKAKQTGADLVTSPVIVFLEPHCIANRGWLEPLLDQLQGHPRVIAIPIVDVLPEAAPGTYTYAPSNYGGFDWGLNFDFKGSAASRNVSYRDPDPFPSPAMSGGLLALWRDWWIESGKYDDQMTEWGSEHIEMSLRAWRCGEGVVGVPCSRVGHLFRSSRPYAFHSLAEQNNNRRLIAAWLEDYTERVYKSKPNLKEHAVPASAVAERLALKERLHCRSMDWYVKTVYPELLSTEK